MGDIGDTEIDYIIVYGWIIMIWEVQDMWRDNMIERLYCKRYKMFHTRYALFSLQYKLTPIRGSRSSYISVMEISGDRSLLIADALRLLMV